MKIRKMTAPAVTLTALAAVWFAGCSSDNSTNVSQGENNPSEPQPVAKNHDAAKGDAMAQPVSLKEGFSVPAFDVNTVSGELKGQTLCYV
jgi:hypothetical protein